MLVVLSPGKCVPIRIRCRSIPGQSLLVVLEEAAVVSILGLLQQVHEVVRRILDLGHLGQDVVSRAGEGESILRLS